jgi:hypothetical protein
MHSMLQQVVISSCAMLRTFESHRIPHEMRDDEMGVLGGDGTVFWLEGVHRGQEQDKGLFQRDRGNMSREERYHRLQSIKTMISQHVLPLHAAGSRVEAPPSREMKLICRPLSNRK